MNTLVTEINALPRDTRCLSLRRRKSTKRLVHHVTIDALQPATDYSVTIENTRRDTVHTFRTLQQNDSDAISRRSVYGDAVVSWKEGLADWDEPARGIVLLQAINHRNKSSQTYSTCLAPSFEKAGQYTFDIGGAVYDEYFLDVMRPQDIEKYALTVLFDFGGAVEMKTREVLVDEAQPVHTFYVYRSLN